MPYCFQLKIENNILRNRNIQRNDKATQRIPQLWCLHQKWVNFSRGSNVLNCSPIYDAFMLLIGVSYKKYISIISISITISVSKQHKGCKHTIRNDRSTEVNQTAKSNDNEWWWVFQNILLTSALICLCQYYII